MRIFEIKAKVEKRLKIDILNKFFSPTELTPVELDKAADAAALEFANKNGYLNYSISEKSFSDGMIKVKIKVV